MIATIVFIAVMAFLIKINPPNNRWWLYWVLILGVAVKCGYKVGIVGVAVWMLISKMLKDIWEAGSRG